MTFNPTDEPLRTKLVTLVAESTATMRALRAARSLGLGAWCIGAGAIRNLVWDYLHGFRSATQPEDMDLVFYDPTDFSHDREKWLERRLSAAAPDFKWDVVNQAAVHQWLSAHAEVQSKPFASLIEGVASWPEVATCVGVSLTALEQIEVIAPHGLSDLFDMVVRWNPTCAPVEVYRDRIAQKRFAERWPRVQVRVC